MAPQGLAVEVEVRMRLLDEWVHLRLWSLVVGRRLPGGLPYLQCKVQRGVRGRAVGGGLVGQRNLKGFHVFFEGF